MAEAEDYNFADDLAQLRAAIDQAKAGSQEIAGALWTFYAALVEEGFHPDQAMMLTVTWFQNLVAPQG